MLFVCGGPSQDTLWHYTASLQLCLWSLMVWVCFLHFAALLPPPHTETTCTCSCVCVLNLIVSILASYMESCVPIDILQWSEREEENWENAQYGWSWRAQLTVTSACSPLCSIAMSSSVRPLHATQCNCTQRTEYRNHKQFQVQYFSPHISSNSRQSGPRYRVAGYLLQPPLTSAHTSYAYTYTNKHTHTGIVSTRE